MVREAIVRLAMPCMSTDKERTFENVDIRTHLLFGTYLLGLLAIPIPYLKASMGISKRERLVVMFILLGGFFPFDGKNDAEIFKTILRKRKLGLLD
jgi:hypothetical protein